MMHVRIWPIGDMGIEDFLQRNLTVDPHFADPKSLL